MLQQVLQYIQSLENVQIGLDIASAFSIIVAAVVFFLQFAKERKRNRSNEIWEYFKEIADDISDIKLEITDVLAKQLYYKEDGSPVTKDDFLKTVPKLKNLTNKLIFHIKYDTKQDIQNILKYYSVKELKLKTIEDIIDKTLDNISKYFECLLRVGEREYKDIEDYKTDLTDITLNELKLTDLIDTLKKEGKLTDLIDKLKKENKFTDDQLTDLIDKFKKGGILTDEANDDENRIIIHEANKRTRKDLSNNEKKPSHEESGEVLSYRCMHITGKYQYSLVMTLNDFNLNLLREIKQI